MGEKNKSIFDLVEQYSSDSEDPHDNIIAIRKILLELSDLDKESFLKLLETTIAKSREIVGSSGYDKSEKNKDKKGSKRYQNNSLRIIEEFGAGPRLLHGETLEERISETTSI